MSKITRKEMLLMNKVNKFNLNTMKINGKFALPCSDSTKV
jgi:hypothetical protein